MNAETAASRSGLVDQFLKWHELLQLAPNVKAVNANKRDNVHASAGSISTLPVECQKALAGEFEVQDAAVVLLREELRCDGSDPARAVLHEVAHTFASAAVRITLLHAKPLVSAG
jgi:hypothetical protein